MDLLVKALTTWQAASSSPSAFIVAPALELSSLSQAMIMSANDPPAPVKLQTLVPIVLDRLQQDDTGRLQAIRDAAKVGF